MQLTIRLLAITPCVHLPESGDAGFTWQVEQHATLESVLQGLQLPPEKTYLSLLNGRSVPVSERPRTLVHEGDAITIFPLIKGG